MLKGVRSKVVDLTSDQEANKVGGRRSVKGDLSIDVVTTLCPRLCQCF